MTAKTPPIEEEKMTDEQVVRQTLTDKPLFRIFFSMAHSCEVIELWTGDQKKQLSATFVYGGEITPELGAQIWADARAKLQPEPSKLEGTRAACDDPLCFGDCHPIRQREEELTEMMSWEQMLLAKFPSFPSGAPAEEKMAWLESFDRILAEGKGD